MYKLSIGSIDNQSIIRSILKHNSQYYQDSSVLYTAVVYSGFGTTNMSMYLPYFIEFRGRLYPKSGFFAPQSGELARSLFQYKKGYTLTNGGLENLYKYTANCYGLDKLSHNDKLNWVKINLGTLLQVGSEDN